MGRRKQFVHDPECAVILNPKQVQQPACTCRDKQKARLKRTQHLRSNHAFEDFATGKQALGNGCYRTFAPFRD